MGVEPGIAVVEADDHADRDHVVAHRVDERSAELAVLRLRPQRPPQRVDHPVERSRDLPHLLDAELPHLGRGVAAQVEVVERDAGEVALRAFGEHGHAGDEVAAGLEVGQLLAVLAATLVAGAHSDHAGPLRRAGSPRTSRGGTSRPPTSARSASQRPTCERETMTLPWLRIGGGVGIGSARSPVSTYTCSLPTGPYVGMPSSPPWPSKRRSSAPGRITAPERRCDPACLPFSTTASGTSPSRSATSGCSSSNCPKRIAQREPRRPGADHEHADLDALVDRIGRFADEPIRVGRRLEVDGTRHQPACLRSNSTSSGTTVWTSPTTARSLNSKIGACGSLLIAMIVFEFCMPTLCCTAPEIPSAT